LAEAVGLTRAVIVALICPGCRQAIEQAEAGFRCPSCGRAYHYREGILSFLDSDSSFNPGEFSDHQEANWSSSARLRAAIRTNPLLSIVNHLRIRCSLSGRRDRVLLQGLRGARPDAIILDVGCGGGRHYLTRFGRVIGIDPVLNLLRQAREIYQEVYQCGGFALPFADASFDYVVSSDVIGHIVDADKDQLFAEMYRVLRKGGRTIHVIETDATNPWFRLARQHPQLFQKHFIDLPGHYGLEKPSELRQRFLKHGFKEVSFRKMSSRVQEVGTFHGMFDNELRRRSIWLSALVGLDGWLAQSLIAKEILNLLLEPIAWLDDVLSPIDYGAGMRAIFEK
jgi:ubiquinone/menaquinone biosynthesis C-methylase UbiE